MTFIHFSLIFRIFQFFGGLEYNCLAKSGHTIVGMKRLCLNFMSFFQLIFFRFVRFFFLFVFCFPVMSSRGQTAEPCTTRAAAVPLSSAVVERYPDTSRAHNGWRYASEARRLRSHQRPCVCVTCTTLLTILRSSTHHDANLAPLVRARVCVLFLDAVSTPSPSGAPRVRAERELTSVVANLETDIDVHLQYCKGTPNAMNTTAEQRAYQQGTNVSQFLSNL